MSQYYTVETTETVTVTYLVEAEDPQDALEYVKVGVYDAQTIGDWVEEPTWSDAIVKEEQEGTYNV